MASRANPWRLVYAVVNHLHLKIPVDELRPSLEQEGAPLIAAQPGFKGARFVKVDDHHGIVILLWETAADAQNGAQKFGPTWFAKNIAPNLASEQQRSVGEIVASRTSAHRAVH